MKLRLLLLACATGSLASFFACNKDDSDSSSADKTTLTIRMGDDPVDAQEVNIDLQEVEIKLEEGDWLSLPTRQGIYNLLAYQNGVDTAIAHGLCPFGSIKEIRLIVGNNNTIRVDGQLHPLTIPSGSESGLKIKIDKKLRERTELVLIDFDADLSIKKENDGYKLRPVIRLR